MKDDLIKSWSSCSDKELSKVVDTIFMVDLFPTLGGGVKMKLFEKMLKLSFCCVVFQERHWTSPGIVAALQAAINTPRSDRLKYILQMAPRLLDLYFAIALRDVNNCKLI